MAELSISNPVIRALDVGTFLVRKSKTKSSRAIRRVAALKPCAMFAMLATRASAKEEGGRNIDRVAHRLPASPVFADFTSVRNGNVDQRGVGISSALT